MSDPVLRVNMLLYFNYAKQETAIVDNESISTCTIRVFILYVQVHGILQKILRNPEDSNWTEQRFSLICVFIFFFHYENKPIQIY